MQIDASGKMVQRRSLTGPMRSESPFSGNPSISSTLRYQSIARDSSQRRSATEPTSPTTVTSPLEKPRTRKPRRAVRRKVSEMGLRCKNDQDVALESPLPQLDRDIDLMAVRDLPYCPALPYRPATYRKIVSPPHAKRSQARRLFLLPSAIRRRIYGFCFPEESRHVTLSPRFATKAVFGPAYFADAWDILDDVRGGLESFGFLRKDLLTFFWSEYHFHVTVNPFSGPRLSPLSHVWLLEHAGSIKGLTVEIDYTRFGGSCRKVAPTFGYNMDKDEKQLLAIFEGLARRRDASTIDELNILCRRYAGFRPHQDQSFQELPAPEPILYRPESSILNLAPYMRLLDGKLRQLRLAGLPLDDTLKLLKTFVDASGEPTFMKPPTPAWPPLPPASIVEYLTSAFNTPISSFSSNFDGSVPPLFPLALTSSTSTYQLEFNRSPSLVREFRNGLGRCNSTASDSTFSNYTIGNDEKTLVEEGEDTLDGAEKSTFDNPTQEYRELVSSFTQSVPSNDCHLSAGTTHTYMPATPRSTTMGDIDAGAGSMRCKLAKPSVRFDSLTPSPPSRATTPRTPNAMNARNEQDPAFVRSVNALCGVDLSATNTDQNNVLNRGLGLGLDFIQPVLASVFTSPEPLLRSTSMQGHRRSSSDQARPARCTTSMSMAAIKRGNVKRKCMNFVNKFIGRTDPTTTES